MRSITITIMAMMLPRVIMMMMTRTAINADADVGSARNLGTRRCDQSGFRARARRVGGRSPRSLRGGRPSARYHRTDCREGLLVVLDPRRDVQPSSCGRTSPAVQGWHVAVEGLQPHSPLLRGPRHHRVPRRYRPRRFY